MKYEVTVFRNAEKAIRKNYEYITESYENEPAACAHTVKIHQKIQSLELFPEGFPIYGERDGRQVRVARVGKYRIFYYVDKENKQVYVLSVVHSHQRMDLSRVIEIWDEENR